MFGSQATGGYFILQLPVSQTADETTEHQWMLITEPRNGDDGGAGDVIVTPVPVAKRLKKIRTRLQQKAERSAG
ncbi:hypothetical protein [Microbacterium sp.]|uniref:hypothetical protein n=1 Tax=Microbacterium sp. TaxID=51671 RepID=UPI00262C9559|nr:hypothetical protein [Microbacterium sp.]